MTNLITHHCYRCEHDWPGRKDTSPKFCPKCHSPSWNKPRKIEPIIIKPDTTVLQPTGNISIGYRTIIQAVMINDKYYLPLPDDWIDKYMANYQDLKFTVRIRGQGIYAVPNHTLSTAKERVMAKHPTCHSILEVIDEQCRQQGITHEQYFERLSKEERNQLKEAIK